MLVVLVFNRLPQLDKFQLFSTILPSVLKHVGHCLPLALFKLLTVSRLPLQLGSQHFVVLWLLSVIVIKSHWYLDKELCTAHPGGESGIFIGIVFP